jgi:hypothetical protein
MASSGVLRRVALVRTDVSEELSASFIRDIPEDGIFHSHRRDNLKPYILLTGRALQRIRNVFPVKYQLGFYILDDGFLHSHRHEYLKFYNKRMVT